jgi:hypothetical protein
MSKMKTILLTAAIVFPIGVLTAGPMRGHPNLEAARNDLNKAWDHISAAQSANEYDMGGHASKAKEMISNAKEELRMAAETANEHR